MATEENDYILVVAIDFGTTYSGCAFQLSKDYKKDNPTVKIMSPQAWNEGPARLTSLKTPSCLLLDAKQEIDSFGYVAEDKYAELCMDGDNKDWYFFRRFKMRLHDTQGLTKDTTIDDEGGRSLPALTVFSKSIECIKMHLFRILDKKKTHVKPEEIKWVLTVPAIWDDTAKQFMREAAENAGIPAVHLSFALEPEAASLFCQYLPVEKFSVGSQEGFSDAKPGTTYMIVDLGGGTADITVHEKVSCGKLKEVHRASGGPWGGTFVDGAFLKMLSDIVGGPVMAAFMNHEKYDYLEMMRGFESVKRAVSLHAHEQIKMKIPVTLSDTCVRVVKKDFKQLVKIAKKDKQISFVGDKAKMDAELVKNLFRKATDKIIRHMKIILEEEACGRKVSLILMVGGFSESMFVQDVIKAEFDNKGGRRVLIPKDAGLSVVQGAVVYGRQPWTIASRVLRFTYGTLITTPFDQKVHDKKRKVTYSGKDYCYGCFAKFIDIGTQVDAGQCVTKQYKTSDPNADSTTIEVFVSEKANPVFTDEESCRSLGRLIVQYDNPRKEFCDLVVEYIFGNTELHIKAMDANNKPCVAKFTMLE